MLRRIPFDERIAERRLKRIDLDQRQPPQQQMHASPKATPSDKEPGASELRLRPWPIGASILWAIAVIGAQHAAMILLITIWGAISGLGEMLRPITPSTPLIWLVSIAAAPAQFAVLALAVRKRGGFIAYLSLIAPDRRSVALGFGCIALLIPLLDLITYALGREVVPPFLTDAYRSAQAGGGLIVLIVAVVIVSPVWEELLFRGFLFRSFCASRAGPKAAIVFTSALWAPLHLQYDWYGVVQVFAIGLVLGWLRLRSGSTLLTITLHMAANLVALTETVVKIEWLS